MAKIIHTFGYDEYKKAAEENKGKSVFALFSGSAGEDGKSWCPDCVQADPVIEACLPELPEDAVFIHCGVGDRVFWKNQENAFRKDTSLRLTSVPTLVKLGSPQRLEEDQCADKELVSMMFKDD